MELHRAAAEAGYEGVQGGDAEMCPEIGLTLLGAGLLTEPEDADRVAELWKAKGAEVISCIAGFGMESDAELDLYAEAICRASAEHGVALLLETHRASVTQDAWRTVQLAQRFPELRFTLDLSHWFTGQEMPYGDIEARMKFIQPVLSRVGLLHGRVGDRCCMQVPLAAAASSLPVFRRVWTEAMQGALGRRAAGEGDLWFCPELLGTTYGYARQVRGATGELCEETDRWDEAKVLVAEAETCFDEAVLRAAAVQERSFA